MLPKEEASEPINPNMQHALDDPYHGDNQDHPTPKKQIGVASEHRLTIDPTPEDAYFGNE